MTACIVQARLGSTRLPAKVLLPLPTGFKVIEEVIFRCARIDGVDTVVAAIPDTSENDIVAHYAGMALGLTGKRRGPVVRGLEHDVLARYAKAAEAVNADVIMRVTSDCPLIDPDVCGQVLKLRETAGAGYVSNSWPSRHFPHGWDCEVFTRDLLDRAHLALRQKRTIASEAIEAMHLSEHVTPWMQKAEGVKRACLKSMEDRSHLRWTLDTLEDYIRIWGVFEEQMREPTNRP